jgi:hypothetical protein
MENAEVSGGKKAGSALCDSLPLLSAGVAYARTASKSNGRSASVKKRPLPRLARIPAFGARFRRRRLAAERARARFERYGAAAVIPKRSTR